jgi:hypothetical protein
MPRRSLRPHLNQIRTWVRQGRTDAWVAHQLDVTVRDIDQFKRQNELVGDGETFEGTTSTSYPEEIDLRAEDDALIAAELEAAELEAAELEAERGRTEAEAEAGAADDDSADGQQPARSRRRTRRGGRGRRSSSSRASGATGALEGTFDHGEEGYGLWLDPAIQDNPIYAEHWAGHRPVEIVIEEDQIVIRRLGEDTRL